MGSAGRVPHSTFYPALDLAVDCESVGSDLEDRLLATLDEFRPLAIQEYEAGGGWRVFFPSSGERDHAARVLREGFGMQLHRIEPVDVPDEDWARRSQAALTAVRVGRLIIAPPWDHPRTSASPTLTAHPGDITIEIDPSMGFGTGHHATTRLCLALLQRQRLDHTRVVDAGTGSGVLAIAAGLLGATDVVGIDYDADALENARENVDRNHAAVELRKADLGSFEAGRADCVLANLTSAVILRHAAALARLVKPGGRIILSGFSPDEAHKVAEAFGVAALETVIEGDWAALLLQL